MTARSSALAGNFLSVSYTDPISGNSGSATATVTAAPLPYYDQEFPTGRGPERRWADRLGRHGPVPPSC